MKEIFTKSSKGQNSIVSWIVFFLISPAFAAIVALYKRNEQGARIITCLFIGLFGFFMNTDETSDLYRYLHSLEGPADYGSISDVFFSLYASGESSSADIYAPLFKTIFKSFTTNGHILLMAFGLVFGFFYSKSLKLFERETHETVLAFLLLVLTLNVFGIQGLAGVRFYTAFYIFLFGTISYINTSEKKYWFIIALSILVHFSYYVALGLFVTYLLLKKYPKLIYTIAILSFLFQFTPMNRVMIESNIFFGDAIKSKVETYSTENTMYLESLSEMREQTAWYVKERGNIAYYVLSASMLLLFILRSKFELDNKCHQYILFTLLMFSFRNIIKDIPDFGLRYTHIFIALSYFTLYNIYVKNKRSFLIKIVSYVNMAGGLLLLLYSLRCIFYYVTPIQLFLSPIITLLF